MSNKPLKASEQKKINVKMQRKKKKIDNLYELPPYMYIVSEGTKTEPYYISGLSDVINNKYSNLSKHERIIVKGTGRNTKGLLEYARKQVEIEFPQASIVWLMYDKDDFPLDNFDNTQHSAEGKSDKREYKVAWSNECIELWFLLHFQELTVNVGREKYKEKLEDYCGYKKNLENIYDILKEHTEIAIRRAKKQYEEYGNLPPSQCCPATRVFEIVEELQKYI